LKVDWNITPELKREGIARELIRHIQNSRKKAGFRVDDRISLSVETDSQEVGYAFNEYKDEVYAETLSVAELKEAPEYEEVIEIDGQSATIKMGRHNSSR
jgi:isoleucyl-tRNA synthetase